MARQNTCDVCGKVTPEKDLGKIEKRYRVDGMKDICRPCSKLTEDYMTGKRLEFATQLETAARALLRQMRDRK